MSFEVFVTGQVISTARNVISYQKLASEIGAAIASLGGEEVKNAQKAFNDAQRPDCKSPASDIATGIGHLRSAIADYRVALSREKSGLWPSSKKIISASKEIANCQSKIANAQYGLGNDQAATQYATDFRHDFSEYCKTSGKYGKFVTDSEVREANETIKKFDGGDTITEEFLDSIKQDYKDEQAWQDSQRRKFT